MKKIITNLFLFLFLCNTCLADCDWSKGISPGLNNTYVYTEECHLEVGKLVQDAKIKDQQIKDLNKAIELKDLAIKLSDDRATLWSHTSTTLENRLQKVDSLEKSNEWLYFGMGVVSTFLASYAAAKLIHP